MPRRPTHSDEYEGDGFEWPIATPLVDPTAIYTCGQCKGHRPDLTTIDTTVDPRWYTARCLDCGTKRSIFTATKRKVSPSHEHTDQAR